MVDATGVANTLDTARDAERGGDWALARSCYERLLGEPGAPDAVAGGRAALLRWVGRTHLEEGRPDSALDAFLAALDDAESRGDATAAAHAVNGLAAVEQQMGDLDRAEELYGRARAQAERAGDEGLIALVDQHLGTIASIRGQVHFALRCYEASLARYAALGLRDQEARVLNDMGVLYTGLGEWAEAESAFGRALATCDAVRDTDYHKRVEVNQMELLVARRELAEARERCGALLRDVPAGGAPWAGEAYRLYGVVQRELNDYDAADEYLKRAAHAAVDTWDLLLAAETAREQAELYWRQRRHTDTLRALNRAHGWFTQLRARRELTTLERRGARLENLFLDVVRRWGEAVEGKDRYTQGHCERVARVACELARRVGFDEKTLFWFRIGALLHDVGKLSVPSEVLAKTGELNEKEWRLMRRHPEAGVALLADIEFPWDVRPMIRNHHERWDGTGYPDRLAGEEIPLAARLLCLADVYDALTTSRPYRAAYSHERAVAFMRKMGGQFDPQLFDVFLEWAEGQGDGAP